MTAASMPIEVQRLMKSYALESLDWAVPADRHAIVAQILTRGDAAAEQWLWSQMTRDEVRSLVRRFAGAGCDEQGRELLRRKLGLSENDVPTRPFAPLPWRG